MNLKLIQQALQYNGGTHTVGDVVDGILAGEYFYLENETTILVFEVIDTPRKKRLHIFLLAGDLENGHKLREQAEDIAKSINAHEVTLLGRKGWDKVLSKHDYQSTHILMVKQL